MSSRLRCALSATLAMAAVLASGAPGAVAAPVTSGTASVLIDYPAPQVDFWRLFDATTAPMLLTGDDRDVTLSIGGGATVLRFAAPPGEHLRPGLYLRAQYPDQRTAGRPGIELSYPSGCSYSDLGSFEVKDIDVGPDGSVRRLWVVFAQCLGAFGEVRIGQPAPAGAPVVAPAHVRWPNVDDAGRPGAEVPVVVRATSAGAVGGASLAGPGASAFSLREDACAGVVLAVGDSCTIVVRFESAAPGTHQAVLRVDSIDRAVLEAFAHGGRTALTMTSDPGDFVGAGIPWAFAVGDAAIRAAGGRNAVSFHVDGATRWQGVFTAPAHDILAPGTYPGARHPSHRGPDPGLYVFGDGRACDTSGSFTVNEARFAADDALRGLSLDFEQHCNAGVDALRGRIEFRAGDTTPPPPWLDQDLAVAGGSAPIARPVPPQHAASPLGGPAVTRGGPTPANASRVRIATLAHGLRLTGGRVVGLRLSCPRSVAACRGSVSLDTRSGAALGRARFALAPGARGGVAITLSARARRLVHRRRTLAVRVHVQVAEQPATTRAATLRRSPT